MNKNNLIEVIDIAKSFPGVKVFDGLDLEIRKGEVHCLCGENGAGKSTLIKILSGALRPDSGKYFINGEEINNMTPHLAMEMGIQTIYQEHTLFPDLNVRENLFAGKEYTNGKGLISKSKMETKAKKILEYLNSDISINSIISSLGSGQQKIVELARGLIQESKVIIMDEPTASFSLKEIDHLLKIVKKLRADGISIIYISHHLEEVFQIADRVTVLRDGKKINTYGIEDITEEILIRDMVGRDVESFYSRESFRLGEVKLEAVNLRGNGVRNVSLKVRESEVLGIAGMVGSGRTEIAELLFGAAKLEEGTIYINGKEVDMKNPKVALDNKMCFITENRQTTGLFLDLTITNNSMIASYQLSKSPFAFASEDKKYTNKFVDKLKIATSSINTRVKSLSGGNQQKVVLAKWFLTKGDIYIFDEPTRGIDIGAKEEIYRVIEDLLREGKSIILISSDMPEIIALSDRIVIMNNGNMVGELAKEEITEEKILKYSIGGLDVI